MTQLSTVINNNEAFGNEHNDIIEGSGFRAKTRLYKVYHIHEVGNNDTSQGYVGITRRTLSYRLSQHFHSRRNIGEVLRSMDKTQVAIECLAMLPKEEALEMEFKLRPERFIGWNDRAGGDRATVRCAGCGKLLPKRKTGAMCSACNSHVFTAGHVPANLGQGERFILTSPEGVVYEPESITRFCREHDLTPQNIRKVAKGRRKHHKGWTCVSKKGE